MDNHNVCRNQNCKLMILIMLSYYSVSSIPTLIIIKDKQEVDQKVGLTSKEKLVSALSAIVTK